MTIEYVIDKLSIEMANRTNHHTDIAIYKQYLQRALVIGIDYFQAGEIVAFNELGVEVGRFESEHSAGRKLHVDPSAISKVVRGLRHSVGHLIFKKLPKKYI